MDKNLAINNYGHEWGDPGLELGCDADWGNPYIRKCRLCGITSYWASKDGYIFPISVGIKECRKGMLDDGKYI